MQDIIPVCDTRESSGASNNLVWLVYSYTYFDYVYAWLR